MRSNLNNLVTPTLENESQEEKERGIFQNEKTGTQGRVPVSCASVISNAARQVERYLGERLDGGGTAADEGTGHD